ncbi:MAG: TIGR04086 family membrane protein [Clostridia bacterium]|nr:TIGR04086 family membrane protein [Clostridia bacterium]
MSQQAVRRFKRAAGKNTALWRGLLLSIAATFAAVVLFSVAIGLWDIPDGVIRVINQVIKVGAIFLGVQAVTPRGDEGGIRRGALLGLVYMGVGVLLYALLTQQKLTWLDCVIDVLMGVAAGGLSGMALGGMKPKRA